MTYVTQGQSLVDVSLQEFGSVAALFDLADANGLAITDALTAGLPLAVPLSDGARLDIADYYRQHAYRVNTGADTRMATAPIRIQDFDHSDFNPNDLLTNV